MKIQLSYKNSMRIVYSGLFQSGPCDCLLSFSRWGLIFILLVGINCDVVFAANPGANNPISTPQRRMLFPDQHALVAVPQDPNSSSTATTYTDWARNTSATSLEFLESFGNTLSGIAEARSAPGHILSQTDEQVAIARFVGSGENNTIQVDVLTPEGETGAPPQQFPAISTQGAFPTSSVVNSFDIASGELSLLEDASGAGHDEVVVCYPRAPEAGGEDRPYVTVLDYTNVTEGNVVQTSLADTSTSFPPDIRSYTSDTRIACDTGDLNHDGTDEVILSVVENRSQPYIYVSIFSYSNNGIDPPSLEPLGSGLRIAVDAPNNNKCSSFLNTVDLATGDYNNDGRTDIAVSTVTFSAEDPGSSTCGSVNHQLWPTVFVISSDSAFNLTHESSFYTEDPFTRASSIGNCINNGGLCNSIRPSVVSGLFRYEPNANSGLDFSRRQLALVYNTLNGESGDELRVHTLYVSEDMQTISENGPAIDIPQQCSSSQCIPSRRYSVDAGGYVGNADIQNPLWSLAITAWETEKGGSGNASGQFRLVWLKANPTGSGVFTIAQDTNLFNGVEINGPVDARLPLAAWDREGNSVWLGSPVHLVLYDLIKTDYIIQEPPKHAYWWPPSATNVADGEIIDLSRVQDFYIELSDSESRDYSFTHTDQTDWTIGGSLGLTGKASVTVGADAGILGAAKATGSISVQGKVGYDYNENVDTYESSYRSQTTAFTGSTNADDLLIAKVMRLDVWRYPVSGIELEDGLSAFWEIVLPGDQLEVQGGGLDFDWYQPPHENGNILSYPRLFGTSYTPPDCCAEFTFVENSEEVVKTEPFLDNRLLFWDGTGATVNLEFSEESGSGSTKSYAHSLKESLDVQIGYKTEAKFLGSKTTTETKVDINVNNSNSWADVDTESASTNNSTGFQLTKPPGNANQSYGFLPVFYLAQDGTTKVTHAADVLATGATFWPQTYGKLPDPALNLPRRFSSNSLDVLVVNESDDARRIRGFFVRYNELSADVFPLVGGTVTEGEVTRIEVEVYNYSTGQGFAGMDVAFSAVKYNPITNSEIGDRIPLICDSGSITGISLNPLEMQTVRCVWDTTDFGPSVSGAIQDYRIYVTLDPDNAIEEIYEGTVGPGQNNEGWGLIGIAHPQDTYRTPTQTEAVPNGADVHMTEKGLALQVNGKLVTESAIVVREQLTPLQAYANTDQSQTGYHHLLVWDGDPDEDGRLLADKLITNIDAEGDSCIWLPNFRFSEAGERILYAQVLETESDALLGNALDTLEVEVLEIPVVNPYRYEGMADNVGSTGDFELSGRFSFSGELDLTAAQLVISRVLEEIGGAGELIPGVGQSTGQSLVLHPRMALPNRAFYSTPNSQTPGVSIELSSANGRLTLDLRVRNADIGEPEFCNGSTELTTGLVLLNGERAPLNLTVTEPWTCERNANGVVTKLVLQDDPEKEEVLDIRDQLLDALQSEQN